MLKKDELSIPTSCLSKAHDNELIFVLLERDHAAPYAIRAWADERIRLRKNKIGDEQINEALACADLMDKSSRFQRARKVNAQNIVFTALSKANNMAEAIAQAVKLAQFVDDCVEIKVEGVVKFRVYKDGSVAASIFPSLDLGR